MASRDDVVTVTRPDGSETSVSRAAWGHTYQYREGWTLVDDQPNLAGKTRAELDQDFSLFAKVIKRFVDEWDVTGPLVDEDAVIAAIEDAE